MSDMDAAKVLSEQNIIFSNDLLSVQERLHQLYKLLIRYDRGSGVSVPEIPTPVEHNTNPTGGAIEPSVGAIPSTNQKDIEKQQVTDSPRADDAVEESIKAPNNLVTETSQPSEISPRTVQESGFVIHDDTEVLHDGQNKEEETNVPVAGVDDPGASRDDVGTTATNTDRPAESGGGWNNSIGDRDIKATNQSAEGENFGTKMPATEPETHSKYYCHHLTLPNRQPRKLIRVL